MNFQLLNIERDWPTCIFHCPGLVCVFLSHLVWLDHIYLSIFVFSELLPMCQKYNILFWHNPKRGKSARFMRCWHTKRHSRKSYHSDARKIEKSTQCLILVFIVSFVYKVSYPRTFFEWRMEQKKKRQL